VLDRLNRYCHGLVAVPVMAACRDAGLFTDAALAPVRGNAGPLAAAFRLLHSLEWVRPTATGWELGPRAGLAAKLPEGLFDLLCFSVPDWLDGRVDLDPWIDRAERRWGVDDALTADLLDGPLLLPPLLALDSIGLLDSAGRDGVADLSSLPQPARRQIVRMLAAKGWAQGEDSALDFGPEGRFLAERVRIAATTASYRPMLGRMADLLFGDVGAVFARDAAGHETHVDRRLNVEGSGFQHEKFFSDVDDMVVDIFDAAPLSDQPRFVADMGSGDGSLLARMYRTVADRAARGRDLERFPLTMIGLDFNARSREATARTLAEAGVPHLVAHGDIGDPVAAVADVRGLGVDDPDSVLHVRSFLDHDRPFKPPLRQDEAAERARHGLTGVNIARDGSLIPAAEAVQSLVEHLERWAEAVGRHGLVALEVHALPPDVVRDHIDQCENLHFDAYHALSGQYLVEADVFLLAMAEAGLFPRPGFSRRYPRALPFTRISVNWYGKRAYKVRHPRRADLADLVALERACWPEPLRASEADLRRRIEDHPAWTLVLEMEGRVVAALYSQRIADADALTAITHEALPGLADPAGRVVHLLGMNVQPALQDKGLGDHLLEFLLLWCGLKADVERVVGLTRFRDWHKHAPMPVEAYLRLTDAEGRCADPIPRFHQAHGAALLGVVRDYRPADTESGGAGVLIAYDVRALGAAGGIGDRVGDDLGGASGEPGAVVESCIRALLGPQRAAGYGATRPLREMGIDSLDLLELKFMLGRAFSTTLDPSFFFQYATPDAIAGYFRGDGARSTAPVPTRAAAVCASAQSTNTGSDAGSDPIAIIGLGCRFPGGDGPDGFWRVLHDGIDTVGPLERRFAATVETGRFAALLDDVAGFDAEFFRISPREAALMDPQQRLLLETAWQALEHAGLPPRQLAGSDTGLFIGLFANDYALLQARANGLSDYGIHFGTGTANSVAAGRLAYVLDTRGPALVVDTACSSSLTAVHLAVRSLRAGECGLALAGGVHLILSPELCATFNQARMLSPDGRCKTMDEAADGYVRGEGCGVVALKRLADAQADGDRVLAVIEGSALTQDGASNGLTAPNRAAQVQVVNAALADAGVAPSQVDYVELHGTGTALGDPVEASALAESFAGRPDKVRIGSVKTNIGHLEAAAGIAGLIKVVLSLTHEVLPASLHVRRLSPHVDWATAPLTVQTEVTPWPRGTTRRVAGVSAFGFSGTNAHVVVAEAPAPRPVPVPSRPVHLLTVSARSEAGLAQQIDRIEGALAPGSLAEMCHTANAGRTHYDHRAVVLAADKSEVTAARFQRGVVTGAAPRIAFLFTGQGSQFPGMGRALYQTEPLVTDILDRCDAAFGGTLLAAMFGDDPAVLNQTGTTQPALFALEVALAALWRSWGIEPAMVLGHSVGEYAAACAAGLFSVEDGLGLIATRARLMQALPAGGAMEAILAEPACVEAAVARHGQGLVSVAAYNGPRNVVVSGAAAAVAAVVAAVKATEGEIQTVPLPVSHAFHSPLMDPMLADFADAVATVRFQAPTVPLIANAAGDPATAAYWVNHVRAPVGFAAGMARMTDVEAFIEIGPRPVLCGMARGCGVEGLFLPSLKPGVSDWRTLFDALAQLYLNGAEIDWRGVDRGRGLTMVSLPGLPFEHTRHWIDERPIGDSASRAVSGLLGRRLDLAGRDIVYETMLHPEQWVADHRVGGRPVLPLAGLLLMVAEATDGREVLDLAVSRPVVAGEGGTPVQTLVHADGAVEIFARDGADWTLRASARAGERVSRLPPGFEPPGFEVDPDDAPIDLAAARRNWAATGIVYGPGFCLLSELRRRPDGGAVGRIETEGLSVAALDSCLQVALVVLPADGVPRLPVSIERFRRLRQPEGTIWSVARPRPTSGPDGLVDVLVADRSGPVAEMAGVRFRQSDQARRPAGEGLLYTVEWQDAPTLSLPTDDQAAALERLERLAALFVLRGLGDLGVPLAPGQVVTVAQVMAQVKGQGVAPARFERLVARLLAILTEDGWRTPDGTMIAPGPALDAWDELERLRADFPDLEAELALFGRCAGALAAVLRGTADPLTLLYPEADLSEAARFYETSIAMAGMNRVLAQTVAAQCGAGARVVEVGAGTGASTAAILPLLPPDTSYLFTDLSPVFTRHAVGRFGRPGFATALLDIERDPVGQGVEGHSFDMVVAANVLHATADLAVTLRYAVSLLAPGGALVLLEGTAPRRWIDLVFGLTEGWWRFTDTDRRHDYALLPGEGWRQVLTEAGLSDIEVIEPPGDRLFAQAVIVARAPAAVSVSASGGAGWLGLVPPGVLRDGLLDAGTVHRVASTLTEAGDLAGYDGVLVVVEPEQDALSACAGVLAVVQSLARLAAPPRLVVATRGAVAAGGAVTAPDLSALWGMGRVVAKEHPELRSRWIDLDPAFAPDEAASRLRAALKMAGGEEEMAVRDSRRLVPRLTPWAESAPPLPGSMSSGPVRLAATQAGRLDSLDLVEDDPAEPGPGQIRVRIHAAGLNFLDVLDVLGTLPFDRPQGLGMEGSGVVEAVGAGAPFAVGDAVVVLAPGCLRSHVVVDARLAAAKPARLSHAEAASLPVNFVTALVALRQRAQVKAGDRVLVHAASGGTGLACVQVARLAGATVLGTTRPDKTAVAERFGVERCFNSRDLAFADETGPVDVVVNALAGPFIAASLGLLGPGGRFVELGKTGIASPEDVARDHPDIAYHPVDVFALCHDDPAAIGALLAEVLEQAAQGRLRLPPRRVFAATRAEAAFRLMQQAGHVGKIVLAFDPSATATIRSDASYLISGGLGGLGLRVAEDLAAQGARHLVLFGRGGVAAAEAPRLAALRESGVTVVDLAADVSSEADIDRVMAALAPLPPLKGVFHAAGVLSDGLLRDQTPATFAAVMAPKVTGGWLLHRATLGLDLDVFVLFSSVAALLGSTGQANHAAANAFLDGLASARRGAGLPALAVDWAGWTETGAASSRAVRDWLEAKGIGAVTPREGLDILRRLMAEAPAQVGVLPMTWERFIGGASVPAFLERVAPQVAQAEAVSTPAKASAGDLSADTLAAQLAGADVAERRRLLDAHVRAQVAKVLGMASAAQVPAERGFFDLGMDSLTSLELRNLLQASLGRALPSSVALDYPTVAALTAWLAGPGGDAGEPEPVSSETAHAALDAVSEHALAAMSDDEAEALLMQRLAEME